MATDFTAIRGAQARRAAHRAQLIDAGMAGRKAAHGRLRHVADHNELGVRTLAMFAGRGTRRHTRFVFVEAEPVENSPELRDVGDKTNCVDPSEGCTETPIGIG